MLHREYFPFLPTADLTPRGPVDPPLLEAEAPPGWWGESARELFNAAEQIASLLQEASECGIPLMTPFSGFCAFTACFLNLYVFRFPRMNLNRSSKAEQLMNWGLEYLEEFQNAWELAGGWVSLTIPFTIPKLTEQDQNDSKLITLIQKSNRRRRTIPRQIKSRFRNSTPINS
jgi:hypothetical protein